MAEVFHRIRCCGKTFTSDEWGEYCKMTRYEEGRRIYTSIGKYTFNDHDICMNPDTMTIKVDVKNAYGCGVQIRVADCGNGLWVYGLAVNTVDGGYCGGPAWTDDPSRGYASERECRIAACNSALTHIGNALKHKSGMGGEGRGSKLKRLAEMVDDYKKSLSRPKIVQLSLFE